MKLLQPLSPMPAILGAITCAVSDHKASYTSHFHIPLIFLFSTFPVMQYQLFFSLFDTFAHFKKFKSTVESIYHKDSNTFRLLNKVKSCSAETVLGWETKYEYPLS